jgi:DNA-binding LacI/PurR family transcriptional regulator
MPVKNAVFSTVLPILNYRCHPYQLGIEGVKLLQERLIEGRKIAKKVFLQPELIIRDSVRKL